MSESASHAHENAFASGGLHPWFTQARLAVPRSGVGSLRGWRLRAALLSVVALLVAVAGSSEFGAVGLRLFADWPVPMAVLMAVVLRSLTLQRCLRLAHELDTGWLATLPISRRRITAALAVVALLILLASAAVVLALLVTAASALDGDNALGRAVASASSGMAVGTALGLWTSTSRRRPASPVVAGRREALFRLDRLNEPGLPHISDWQRRTALLRWRSGEGGHFWLIGAVLIVAPSGISPRMALGAMLLVGCVLWLGSVLRASLDVTGKAHELLRPTPVRARSWQASSLRYPLFALACAATLLAVGHALIGFSLPRVLLSMAIPILVCLPEAWKLMTLLRRAP